MKGNPHYDDATYIDRDPQIRLIDATLALAFEQRTANLLAVTEKQYLPGANDEVKERLGHGRGVEPPTPAAQHPAKVFETAMLEVEEALSAGLKDISYGEDRNGDPDTGFYHIHVDGTVDVPAVTRKIVEALRLRGCL